MLVVLVLVPVAFGFAAASASLWLGQSALVALGASMAAGNFGLLVAGAIESLAARRGAARGGSAQARLRGHTVRKEPDGP